MAKTSTSFKSGEVHNPNGRPKKEWTMTGALKVILEKVDPATRRTGYEALMDKAHEMALKGDTDMLKYLTNRIDGMPKQQQEHSGSVQVLPILGGGSVSEDNSSHENTGSE